MTTNEAANKKNDVPPKHLAKIYIVLRFGTVPQPSPEKKDMRQWQKIFHKLRRIES